MKHVLEYMENEPAPAVTGTSSEVSKDTDNIHLDDSALLDICQVVLTNISEGYGDNYSSGYAQATLLDCKHLKSCLESSRRYPCKDFKPAEPTILERKGRKHDSKRKA